MSWTLDRIVDELNKISNSKGDTFSIPVSLNSRLTRTLGRVRARKNNKTGKCIVEEMEFSKNFITNGTDEEIKSVIAHEWAHYYITKTTAESHAHDTVFMDCAEEVGGHTAPSININKNSISHKYSVYCSECGKLVGEYNRAGKTVKEPHLYKSGCCGANLRVEQNR